MHHHHHHDHHHHHHHHPPYSASTLADARKLAANDLSATQNALAAAVARVKAMRTSALISECLRDLEVERETAR